MTRLVDYDPGLYSALGRPVVTFPSARFGASIGVTVLEDSRLKDGTVVHMYHRWIFVGVRPLDLMEEVGREARLTVREGMKSVLEQLGQSWYNEPTGDEVLEQFKSLKRCGRSYEPLVAERRVA